MDVKGSGSRGAKSSSKHDDQKRAKVTSGSEHQIRHFDETSSTGKCDRPLCVKNKEGQSLKDQNCDHWHPPVCIFHRKRLCRAGNTCPFVHLDKDDRLRSLGRKTKGDTPKDSNAIAKHAKTAGNLCMKQVFMQKSENGQKLSKASLRETASVA